MSQKKMSKSLASLVDSIRNLKADNWQDVDLKLEAIGNKFKRKDFKALFTNEEVFNMAFHYDESSHSGRWNRQAWMAERGVEYLLPLCSDVADEIIRESEIDSVKTIAIRNGIYKDISIIDEVAKSGSGDSQLIAASFCSIEALRELKDHKSSKIRKIYYNRLGPVECLDEMLCDKIADIRHEGVARAPYFYEKLKEMTKEIARGPFTLLVEKISLDYLPMLVANRNVKNSWISRKFDKRISSGR